MTLSNQKPTKVAPEPVDEESEEEYSPLASSGGSFSSPKRVAVIVGIVAIIALAVLVMGINNSISKNSESVKTLQASLTKTQTDITTAIESATKSITDMQSVVNNIPNTVSSQVNTAINNSTSSINNQINSMQSQVDNMAGVVKSATDKTNSFEASINSFNTNLTNGMESVNKKIDGINTTIDTLSGTVDGLSTKVDGLSTNVDGLSTNVSVLQQQIDDAEARITALEDNPPPTTTTTAPLTTYTLMPTLFVQDCEPSDLADEIDFATITLGNMPLSISNNGGSSSVIWKSVITNTTDVDIEDLSLYLVIYTYGSSGLPLPILETNPTLISNGGNVGWSYQNSTGNSLFFVTGFGYGASTLNIDAGKSITLWFTLTIQWP